MIRPISSLALAGLLASAAIARAQDPASDLYSLAGPPSAFEFGCFAPCECPVRTSSPLEGTFVLRLARTDPLYNYYDVLDVRWTAPGSDEAINITGSGKYMRGGEVAIMEQLTLDLSFNGAPSEHFDSGLRSPGAPFPAIDIRISLHGEYCWDSVLAVVAKPKRVAEVGPGPPPAPLTATPNPFRSSTEVSLSLARSGVVSLGVFDLAGRRVRALVSGQWLAAGPQVRAWDGRLDGGAAAPAGLYVLRLESPSGPATRTLVKLQ